MPFVDVEGAKIYYEVHGAGPGLPALLLMGLGTDAHGWERVLPALTSERRVVVLDNRGIGRSSKPRGPYTTAMLAADARAVLGHADIGRAHVAGLSLGGMIAQELALAEPGLVASLALLATWARPDAGALALAREGAASGAHGLGVEEALGAIREGRTPAIDFAKIFQFLMPRVLSPAFLEREAAYLAAFFARSMEYGLSADGYAGQLAAAIGHDTTARLPTITAPTLVVAGTADALIAPSHADVIAKLVPGAKLVRIEGGPHGLNFENADELSRELATWFRDNDPS
jgi:pimeloyl-ACP methyl ester carboxylesterase